VRKSNKMQNLKSGEWVEVRSKEEILRTLDSNGQLESLPFMPQMFQYCGQRLRVDKRAHKTCDTVTLTGGRRMVNAVHLEGLRCDGKAYGGCQAGCLMFWKEAWLKRSNQREASNDSQSREQLSEDRSAQAGFCTEADVIAGTRATLDENDQDPSYVCQITQLPRATSHLPMLKISQYVEDYTSGNVTLRKMICGFIYAGYYWLSEAGIGVGPLMRWFYDRFQAIYGGIPFPRKRGTVGAGERTPECVLNLEPDELVRVKPYEEILATLNTANRNRGLLFDAEMVPYCGEVHRVLKRVHQILDEKTGKLMRFKNACIVLEDVVCQSRYSECKYCPLFCPRGIYSYWREIWLERVAVPTHGAASESASNIQPLLKVRDQGDRRDHEL
jgi:hypothetical protein